MSWPIARLKEESSVITKGTTPTTLGQKFQNSGIPFLRAQNLVDGSVSVSADPLFISPETHDALKRSKIQPSDILISIAGTIGRAAIVPDNAVEMNCNQAVAIVRPSDRIDRRFFLHWLAGSDAISQVARSTVTGVISNLSLGQIGNLEFPLPPLSEQRRIAAILDKADAIRRKREQALTLADDFLKSVFLEMFGDPENNERQLPRRSFHEIADIDTRMVKPTEDPFIDMYHVGPDIIVSKTGKILQPTTAREEGLKSGKYLFDDNHVLYTKIRPLLQKVAMPSFAGICSADVYPIRAIEGVSTKEFIWSVLISDAFVAYFHKLPDRANIPKMNMKELNAYECIYPTYELQVRYSEIVQSVRKTVAKSEAACLEANDLFASLSQRAFNGEL